MSSTTRPTAPGGCGRSLRAAVAHQPLDTTDNDRPRQGTSVAHQGHLPGGALPAHQEPPRTRQSDRSDRTQDPHRRLPRPRSRASPTTSSARSSSTAATPSTLSATAASSSTSSSASATRSPSNRSRRPPEPQRLCSIQPSGVHCPRKRGNSSWAAATVGRRVSVAIKDGHRCDAALDRLSRDVSLIGGVEQATAVVIGRRASWRARSAEPPDRWG